MHLVILRKLFVFKHQFWEENILIFRKEENILNKILIKFCKCVSVNYWLWIFIKISKILEKVMNIINPILFLLLFCVVIMYCETLVN